MEVYNRYNGSRKDPTQHEKDLLDKIIKVQDLAREFLELSKERDTLNKSEDYSEAFEVECRQRDVGQDMALLMLNKQRRNNMTDERELREALEEIQELREELDKEQCENSTFRDENAELDTLREALDAERLFKQKVLQGVIEERDMLADENAKMAKFLKENGSWAHKELTDDDVDDIATTGDLRK